MNIRILIKSSIDIQKQIVVKYRLISPYNHTIIKCVVCSSNIVVYKKIFKNQNKTYFIKWR